MTLVELTNENELDFAEKVEQFSGLPLNHYEIGKRTCGFALYMKDGAKIFVRECFEPFDVLPRIVVELSDCHINDNKININFSDDDTLLSFHSEQAKREFDNWFETKGKEQFLHYLATNEETSYLVE